MSYEHAEFCANAGVRQRPLSGIYISYPLVLTGTSLFYFIEKKRTFFLGRSDLFPGYVFFRFGDGLGCAHGPMAKLQCASMISFRKRVSGAHFSSLGE